MKLKKITTEGSSLITTEYAGNYIYENGALQFLNTAEGYAEPVSTDSTAFKYVYQYKDHLGNIRLSYKDVSTTSTPVLQILEENNYYPFGLQHKGYNNVVNSTNPAQKFKYNGVEYEESLGLNLYEMDFRQYDSAIARFTAIDPITNLSQSTYTAFDNNPIFWIDPSGADSTDPIVEKNTIIFSTVDNKSNVTRITQVTTTATINENEDGSVTVSISTQSVSNTIDANGNVTKGTSVNVSSGSLTKDSNGNVSTTKSSTSSRQITSDDNTSALGEFTNVISDYNRNNKGIYNEDKINSLADKTTDATEVGMSVLGVFGGLDKLFGKLDPKQKALVNLLGGTTSTSSTAEGAGFT